MSTSVVFAPPPGDTDVQSWSGPAQLDSGLTLLVRLEIARELVGALDQATGAGQLHLMNRVVRILRRAALTILPRAAPNRWPAVTGLADALEREVRRVAPDLKAFRERAARLAEIIEGEALGPAPAQGAAPPSELR